MAEATPPLPEFADQAQLRARVPGFLEVRTGIRWTLGAFTRYAVGFSWITHGFDAQPEGGAAQGLIVRLGSPYGLFAPYSAQPQYTALRALAGCGVPVPQAYWWRDDPGILGAPLFISERVAGTAPVPNARPWRAWRLIRERVRSRRGWRPSDRWGCRALAKSASCGWALTTQ